MKCLVSQSVTMIGTIHLSGSAEPLAWRTTHDQVHVRGADQSLKFRRRKRGEILFQDMWHVLEICLIHLNRLMIEVDGGKSPESRAFKPEAETAAAAEEVEEGWRNFHEWVGFQERPEETESSDSWEAEISGRR